MYENDDDALFAADEAMVMITGSVTSSYTNSTSSGLPGGASAGGPSGIRVIDVASAMQANSMILEELDNPTRDPNSSLSPDELEDRMRNEVQQIRKLMDGAPGTTYHRDLMGHLSTLAQLSALASEQGADFGDMDLLAAARALSLAVGSMLNSGKDDEARLALDRFGALLDGTLIDDATQQFIIEGANNVAAAAHEFARLAKDMDLKGLDELAEASRGLTAAARRHALAAVDPNNQKAINQAAGDVSKWVRQILGFASESGDAGQDMDDLNAAAKDVGAALRLMLMGHKMADTASYTDLDPAKFKAQGALIDVSLEHVKESTGKPQAMAVTFAETLQNANELVKMTRGVASVLAESDPEAETRLLDGAKSIAANVGQLMNAVKASAAKPDDEALQRDVNET